MAHNTCVLGTWTHSEEFPEHRVAVFTLNELPIYIEKQRKGKAGQGKQRKAGQGKQRQGRARKAKGMKGRKKVINRRCPMFEFRELNS